MVEPEKFGAEQPDALRARGAHRGDVRRFLDVRGEDEPGAVEGHRRLVAQVRQALLQGGVAFANLSVLEEGGVCRVDHQHAAMPVDQRIVPGLDAPAGVAESGHGRDAQLARHDGGVAGLATHVGGEAEDLRPVDHRGHARRDVVGDHHHRFAQPRQFALAGKPQQLVQHPAGHIAQIGRAFAEVFILRRIEGARVAVHHLVEGEFGIAMLVADQRLHLAEQGHVLENEEMRLKDARLMRAHGGRHAPLDLLDLMPGDNEGRLEPFQFRLGLPFAERVLGYFRGALADAQDARVGHSARERDAAEGAFPGWLSFRHDQGLRKGTGDGNGFFRNSPGIQAATGLGRLRKFDSSWRPFSVRMLSG